MIDSQTADKIVKKLIEDTESGNIKWDGMRYGGFLMTTLSGASLYYKLLHIHADRKLIDTLYSILQNKRIKERERHQEQIEKELTDWVNS